MVGEEFVDLSEESIDGGRGAEPVFEVEPSEVEEAGEEERGEGWEGELEEVVHGGVGCWGCGVGLVAWVEREAGNGLVGGGIVTEGGEWKW